MKELLNNILLFQTNRKKITDKVKFILISQKEYKILKSIANTLNELNNIKL